MITHACAPANAEMRRVAMSAGRDLETKRTWTIPESTRLELLAALSSRGDGSLKMTWEEFREWSDEDTRAEWVDGEVIMSSPISVQHQRIANFLQRLLSDFIAIELGGVSSGGRKC
jgi:Putative restriction endonuclease